MICVAVGRLDLPLIVQLFCFHRTLPQPSSPLIVQWQRPTLWSVVCATLLSKCIVMNFKVLMEARRDWHAVFGFVSISLTTAQDDIGVDLLGCSLLVRLAAVLNVSHL